MLQIFSQHKDHVINSLYITAHTSYKKALEKIVPLMDKLSIQRKIQSTKFYERLSKDIVNGCIMPPLTLAFVDKNYDYSTKKSLTEIQNYITSNIENAFVLDGIQRLNTLKRASLHENFNEDSPIFFNILICPSNDKLLYRMITLNNGQKPMSTRHQVEILLAHLYNFTTDDTIQIVSEKEATTTNSKTSFKKSSFINGYLAFLSNSINIDNKKIIEEKLDELLGNQIMEYGVKDNDIEFKHLIEFIADFSKSDIIKKWFQNENNLIGFCVASREKKCFETITTFNIEEFENIINQFEKAFASLDKSKIRIGTFRRKIASFFFKNIEKIRQDQYDDTELLQFLMEAEII